MELLTLIMHYSAVFLSDSHLGIPSSRADLLLKFFHDNTFDKLYLNGDIVDLWALQRRVYWIQDYNDVIQKILKAARAGVKVYYIWGNHCEYMEKFRGNYGNIEFCEYIVHTTKAGEEILIFHGHQLDIVIRNVKWLAYLGDIGYNLLLSMNSYVNFIRKALGRGHWSLSKYVKTRVKEAVSFVGAFEENVVKYTRERGYNSSITGHLHMPAVKTLIDEFGKFQYYNCGDLVESNTILVENQFGNIEILVLE